MSRIDEALRRVAETERVPGDRLEGLKVEPRTELIDSTILERYAIERPARVPEAVHQTTTTKTAASRVNGSAPIRIPPAFENKLVVGQDIWPLTVEQYRRLAAVLHHLQAEHGMKTLMVTSAVPQEGKTLTVTNLALTLSESYQQRVLLIDADLRRPSVHELLGITNGVGLADIVADRGRAMPVVEVSPQLSVLTAGRRLARPLALLTSERMSEVIADAAAGFDWVLLDTPPVGLLPDAQLLARLTEGVLFVIAAGVTPYPLVRHAVNELGKERIVGTVLNQVEKRTLAANDSYGGYYGTQVPERSHLS
jgi:capsular exopolysaccharide synthesis family protein